MSLAITSAFALNSTATHIIPECTRASGELVKTTELRVQPIWYSEEFNLVASTVVDPFRRGESVTVGPGPTTIITSDHTTATASYVVDPTFEITVYFPPFGPGTSTTSTSSTSTSSATGSEISSSTSTTTPTTITTTASMSIPTSTIPITSATTCTLSAVASPSQADIAAAINQWQQDIGVVNSFLETALDDFAYTTFNAIRAAAIHGYNVAVDEPCQFQTLQSALGPLNTSSTYQNYLCAQQDLAGVFGTEVLDNLSAAIVNPPQFDPLVTRINVNRCCRVLPDVQILFTLASEINGAGASPQPQNLVVPIPDTCSLVDCNNFPSRTPCQPVQ